MSRSLSVVFTPAPIVDRFSGLLAEIPPVTHQDLGRLLLLHLRRARGASGPRRPLRQHGPGDDRGYQVSGNDLIPDRRIASLC